MISACRTLRAFGLFTLVLAVASASLSRGAESRPKVAVVAFGLYGDQDVFEREANGAARIAADRLGGNPVIVRANTKSRTDATPDALAATLQSVAKAMDGQNDILFLILTSHGSKAGIAVKAGTSEGTLPPGQLAAMLDNTMIRHRVVIISACYSGVFVHPLADPDTLIITAADADHPSFGCRNGADWTYFGDAFFNNALRRTANLKEAFTLASALVRKRELQSGQIPSNPQMAGGENIEHLLKGESDRVISREAIAADPKYAFARGFAYAAKGDSERAIAAYSEAIRFDSKDAAAYINRASAYGARRDNDRAIADYSEVIRLNPKSVEAYNNRGSAYVMTHDNDRAIADYTELIRLEPKNPVGYHNRGFAYAAAGDQSRAIVEYSAAIRLAPKYALAYSFRGLAYRAKGDNVHASADFKEAIRLDPKVAPMLKGLGIEP